jgi:hypothetical protein
LERIENVYPRDGAEIEDPDIDPDDAVPISAVRGRGPDDHLEDPREVLERRLRRNFPSTTGGVLDISSFGWTSGVYE